MITQIMTQYLFALLARGDLLATSRSPLDSEDIIMYTLNELSPCYQAFKIAIHTNFQPISLNDLHSLLFDEEINQANEANYSLQPSFASQM